MLNRSDLLLQNQALVRANHRFLAPKCSKSLDSTRQDKDIEYGREKKGEEGEIVSSGSTAADSNSACEGRHKNAEAVAKKRSFMVNIETAGSMNKSMGWSLFPQRRLRTAKA